MVALRYIDDNRQREECILANCQYYVVVSLCSPPACHGLLGAGQEDFTATVSPGLPHLDGSYNWLEKETEQLFIVTLMYS